MFVMIRNPNQKYVRECVWTLEQGEETGTPHIQAWIRLQRNQTLSFMRKLYPGGHFKFCAKDEYNENTHQYAQKNDQTTVGQHIITLNDPLPSAEAVYYRICDLILEHEEWDDVVGIRNWAKTFATYGANVPSSLLKQICIRSHQIELDLVAKERGLEKILMSPTFERFKQFFPQTLFRLWTNKQTNKQEEEKISRPEITNNTDGVEEQDDEEESDVEQEDSEDDDDYEEGASCTSEGSDESGSVGDCSEDVGSEDGEQVHWVDC